MDYAMKLNIGCGPVKMNEYINIDKYPAFFPDVVMDIEVTPWEFEDNSVDEVILSHVLEHIGSIPDVFFGVVKELYRVLRPGGLLKIRVPHPRHDNFFADPTHVRAFMPGSFLVFSKDHCRRLMETGGNTFMLAVALDVDFAVDQLDLVMEPRIMERLADGRITTAQLAEMGMWSNNVYSEIVTTLRCLKTPA